MMGMSRVAARTDSDDALLMRLGWEEYLRLDDVPGLRFEYDEGRLIVSPSGANAHDLLIRVLADMLGRYEDDTQDRFCVAFTEHSFFMPPGRRDLRPDLGIVTNERKERPIAEDGWIEGAPDIAVEVLSPSTEERDRTFKATRYYEAGSSEYWLFDPIAQTAEFFRRGESGWQPTPLDGTAYRTPLLPGFNLDLTLAWRRLRRKLRSD